MVIKFPIPPNTTISSFSSHILSNYIYLSHHLNPTIFLHILHYKFLLTLGISPHPFYCFILISTIPITLITLDHPLHLIIPSNNILFPHNHLIPYYHFFSPSNSTLLFSPFNSPLSSHLPTHHFYSHLSSNFPVRSLITPNIFSLYPNYNYFPPSHLSFQSNHLSPSKHNTHIPPPLLYRLSTLHLTLWNL